MLGLTGIIIILVILVGLFILLREVNCWYWKINKRIELMEENNRLLNILIDAYTSNDAKVVVPSPSVNSIQSTFVSDDTESTFTNNSPSNVVNTTPSAPAHNFRSVQTFDRDRTPPVLSFSNGKIIFADGIQGEIMTDQNHQLYITIGGSKRYYYDSEENAINAIYILKTKGEISPKGLKL